MSCLITVLSLKVLPTISLVLFVMILETKPHYLVSPGTFYFKTIGLWITFSEETSGSESGMKADCLLPKVVGPCRAAMPRFYYNNETQACEEFIYGGCSGNDNNFQTREECERVCQHN